VPWPWDKHSSAFPYYLAAIATQTAARRSRALRLSRLQAPAFLPSLLVCAITKAETEGNPNAGRHVRAVPVPASPAPRAGDRTAEMFGFKIITQYEAAGICSQSAGESL
jgi:hypothetical protein